MPLYIEQRFPLGRFHATRWKQGAFGDPYGEWPPSPWRLLRALAFRWFQWSRETGETSRTRFDTLIKALAQQPPEFYLPAHTWLGEAIKQYLPTEVTWTDASKKASAYRKPKTTLNEDHYRAVSSEDAIYWVWSDPGTIDSELLDALLARILYFGRAESWTRIKRISSLPANAGFRCVLEKQGRQGMVPVLVPAPGNELNMEVLLATTEKPEVRDREIPPGTEWRYARIPEPPKIRYTFPHKSRYPTELHLLQFAVGGRVFPPMERWVIVAERFRGRVLRERFRQITGETSISYAALTTVQKEKVCLLSGKDAEGRPLANHPHAYFTLIPNEYGQPTRMAVWRKTPFTEEEIEAILTATEKEIYWDNRTPKWPLKLLPLPFDINPHPALTDIPASTWRSLTPFVPPRTRHRFRKRGRERPGEMPERIVVKLLTGSRLPVPDVVETLNTNGQWVEWNNKFSTDQRKSKWVTIHRSLRIRMGTKPARECNVALGYYIRLKFKEPIKGPLVLGESSHFGLGLFVPEPGSHNEKSSRENKNE